MSSRVPNEDLPELDATGLRCPLPVLKARPFLKGLPPGSRAVIRSDDPVARVDLPALCHQDGHTVLDERLDGAVFSLTVATARPMGEPGDEPGDEPGGEPGG